MSFFVSLWSKITIIKVPKGGLLESFFSETGDLFFQNYIGYFWIIVALTFLFVELNTPGLFFFVAFAVGALSASALSFLGYSVIVQCSVGLIVALFSFFIMKKYLKKKNLSDVTYDSPITNIDALIGKQGIVVESILKHYKGRVHVGGELWLAKSEGGELLEKGVGVVVLRVEGNTVVVQPLKKEEHYDSV